MTRRTGRTLTMVVVILLVLGAVAVLQGVQRQLQRMADIQAGHPGYALRSSGGSGASGPHPVPSHSRRDPPPGAPPGSVW